MRDHLLTDELDRFRVEPWLDWLGAHVARRSRLWRRIGDWESYLFNREIQDVPIVAPIFVCGLARSGSTILLECLAAHPDTVTHRYRDYPGVLAPVFWDRISTRLYTDHSAPIERAHGDGIAVTPDSAEAMEEMLWMEFYPHSHDPSGDNRIGRGEITPQFAAFYRDHVRKLLWLRRGRRFLSKENYNLVRLGALIELFPDARIIVPLRDPVAHIGSLMRQHALFSAAQAKYPAALRYMQRVGHYEFGLDRRPLNVGNTEAAAAVRHLWHANHEVEGWSAYWAMLHEFVIAQLDEDAALRDATLLVRFEDLCADPAGTLGRILSHARLPVDDAWLAESAQRIRAPASRPSPDQTEEPVIRGITAAPAARLGYGNN
jgi:Sulfotransferase family